MLWDEGSCLWLRRASTPVTWGLSILIESMLQCGYKGGKFQKSQVRTGNSGRRRTNMFVSHVGAEHNGDYQNS